MFGKKKSEKEEWKVKRVVKNAMYDASVFIHQKVFSRLRKNRRGTMKKAKLKDRLFIWCMLAIPLTMFCVFYIGVNFNSILLAFKEYDSLTGGYKWAEFSQFKLFFDTIANEPFMKYAIRNSAIYFSVSLFVLLPIQVMNAYYVYKKRFLGKFFKVMLFMPSILSTVVLVTIFRFFATSGLPDICKALGIKVLDSVFGLKHGMTTMIVYTIWQGFGGSIILFVGTMTRIPTSVVEAAQIDGITPLKEFFSITLPLVFPTVMVYIVSTVSGFFTLQGPLFTFYGKEAYKEHYTFGYYYFVSILGDAGVKNYPMASAAGLLFTVIIAPITLGLRKFFNKICPPVDF